MDSHVQLCKSHFTCLVRLNPINPHPHLVNIWNQCPSLFPICQDLRNSQARNAARRLEAFHQPLSAEECSDTGTSWASSAAVRARTGRLQSHGGQGGQAQTVKHTRTHTREQTLNNLLNHGAEVDVLKEFFFIIQRTVPFSLNRQSRRFGCYYYYHYFLFVWFCFRKVLYIVDKEMFKFVRKCCI